ncbi:MAG: hypothetical protein ACR2J4_06255 [Deinococcus sp.]
MLISILPRRQLRAGVLKRVRSAQEGAVDDQPEAFGRIGEAEDKPGQHVLWQPDVLEEAVQLLHFAALKDRPRQLGGQFGESDVLALDQREDQGGEERQAGGPQAPRVFGEVNENGRMR